MALAALRDAWPERPLAAAAEGLVLAALLFCPWALGGVAPWAVHAFEALALLAALCSALEARASGRRLAWGLGGAVLLAMTGAVALQLVPLPAGLLARLAPATDDLLRFTLGPHGLYPAARPLTLDVSATAFELGKHAGYLALYLAAAQVCRERRARRRLMYGLGALGLSLAGCAALHAVFELHGLFGVEALRRQWLVTPFVNRNHLASALALSALVQAGLAFRTDDRRGAFAWGFGALGTGAAAVLSGSRAGALAFVAGVVVFAAFLGRRSEGEARERSLKVALGVALAVSALGLAAFLNADRLTTQWASLTDAGALKTSVIQLWPTVLPLVREHWLTGVGRGAFQAAFTHDQTTFLDYTVTHPEDVLLQATSEFGAVLGLAFLVLLAGAWVEAARRRDLSAAEAGVLAGLFAVGLHELADFGLELTGVAAPCVVALAVAEVRPESRLRLGLGAGAGLLAALGAAAALCWARGGQLLEADRASLEARVGKAPPEEVVALARERLARHPADYFLHLAPALAYARASPPQPGPTLAWANRAMYLAPHSPWPHRLAAEALFALGGRKQALLEESLAFDGAWLDPSFRTDLQRLLRGPEEYAGAVPQTAEGFARAIELLGEHRAEALLVGELALGRLNLEEPGLLTTLAGLSLGLNQPVEALAYADRAVAADPRRGPAYAHRAEALRRLGREAEVEGALRQGLEVEPGSVALSLPLAERLAKAGQRKEAHELLARVSTPDIWQRFQAMDLDARLYQAEGQPSRAVSVLRDACALAPSDPGRRWELARLLEQQGRLSEALRSINDGLALPGGAVRQDIRTWRDQLQARLEQQRRDYLLHEPPPGGAP